MGLVHGHGRDLTGILHALATPESSQRDDGLIRPGTGFALVGPRGELIDYFCRFRDVVGMSQHGVPSGHGPCIEISQNRFEVSRAVSSPQEGGQTSQIPPMSAMRFPGQAPIGALQEVR